MTGRKFTWILLSAFFIKEIVKYIFILDTLSDFVFNSFKKISKHLEMQSIEVLLGFLSQTSGEKEIEDFEDIEEENPNRKGIGKKKVKNGMFEDLENDDVKMA